MSELWEAIAQKVKGLPPEQQAEVLDFVDSLRGKAAQRAPLASLAGIWKGFDLEQKDFDEARRDVWARSSQTGRRSGPL